MNMKGKKIVLGITGSIAAYKAAILIRALIKKGAEVQVVITPAGVEVFNFGKYRRVPVKEILQKDPGYYSWIIQGDFTLNTKNVLTKIRLRETGLLK